MTEPLIGITRYASQLSTDGTYDEVSWDDLRALLSAPRETGCDPCPAKNPDGSKHSCPEKGGPSWSPVALSGTRKLANVRHVTALVLDLDHLRTSDYREALHALRPYQYLLHSTHSHRPPEDRCFRAVVALSRAVTKAEWPTFFAAATTKLAVKFDPVAKDASRLYFLPSAPTSRLGFFYIGEGAGELLDVDAIMRDAVPVKASLEEDAPAPPPRPISLSMEDYAEALKALRRKAKLGKDERLASIFDNALNGRMLVPPGEGQEPALHQAASALGFKLPPGTDAAEAVQFTLRTSINAMGAGPEGLDYWARKAERSFQEAAERRNAADAALDAFARRFAPSTQRLFAASVPTPPSKDEEDPPPDEVSWRDLLSLSPKGGGIELRPWGSNVSVILRESPEWKAKVRFDSLRNEIVLDRDCPLGHIRQQNTLGRKLDNYLQREWGINVGEIVAFSCLMEVARDHSFDPLLDSLLDLQWDGTHRLDTMLERALEARTTDDEGRDITDHVRRISRKFMVSAAARAIRPGTKVDTVLVLEGPQGGGKTSFLRMLAGSFYSEPPKSLEDKDAKMLASAAWVVEIAELASFRRSDADALKAFFTTQVDKFRPPFGRAIEEFPRRCIFVGTVNPDGAGYLTDRTGNRRYWPVVVGDLDRAWFRENRGQLLAEAVYLAEAAFKVQDEQGDENVPADLRWWLDRDEEIAAANEAQARMKTTPMAEMILDYLLAMAPEKRPTTLLAHDVARDILGMPAERIALASTTSEIGYAFKALGFTSKKVRRPGGYARPYTVPEHVLKAPQTARSKPSTFSLIAGGRP